MKSLTRRIISILATASFFLLVMFFSSCSLQPAKASTPAQRIQYFQQDLNNGGKASDLINDMWSGMADYGALKDQNTWDISVLAGAHAPYSFSATGSAASTKL